MDSKDKIKNQFMKEYMRKDFSLISVKELCAAAPVARTTFYSHFDNIDDVRSEIEDDLINGLLEVSKKVSGGNYQDMDFNRFMDETEVYIKEHWSSIYAFLVKQPNLRFMRKWKDAIIMNFSKRYPYKQNSRIFDTVAEIVASSMLSAYTYWMENPDKCDPKDIKPIIQKVLNSLIANI